MKMNEGTTTRSTMRAVPKRNLRARAARRSNLGKAPREIPTGALRWMLQPPVAYQCFDVAGAHQRLTGEAGQATDRGAERERAVLTANRSAVMASGVCKDARRRGAKLADREIGTRRDGEPGPKRTLVTRRGRVIESSLTLKLLVLIPNVWVGFAPSIGASIHKHGSQQTVKPADAVINRE